MNHCILCMKMRWIQVFHRFGYFSYDWNNSYRTQTYSLKNCILLYCKGHFLFRSMTKGIFRLLCWKLLIDRCLWWKVIRVDFLLCFIWYFRSIAVYSCWHWMGWFILQDFVDNASILFEAGTFSGLLFSNHPSFLYSSIVWLSFAQARLSSSFYDWEETITI